MRTWFLAAALLALLPLSLDAGELKLKDGDRVILLGSTVIEREQRYGYWEEGLTAAFPRQQVIFRNLGWSGDNVFGIARASFGSQADGFNHLKEHVESIKPSVILLAYGTNESFDGEAGLPRFQQGLDTLLDALAKTQARIILLSPPPMEKHGKILPDPTGQNRDLRLYSDALKLTATKRKLDFADLFNGLGGGEGKQKPSQLTDNGMHLTGHGYWWSFTVLQRELGLSDTQWRVELDGNSNVLKTTGTNVSKGSGATLTDDRLPLALPSDASEPRDERLLVVRRLKAGKYTLQIDGKAVHTGTDQEWATGVLLTSGPEFDQAEKLRTTIIAKNREYFHRWRPENETYLFGFRKHEQGQNAVEIPKFDPIVADLEEQIAKLRVPLEHRYEIVPVN
jgi:lysophospholipase L1-like esterase